MIKQTTAGIDTKNKLARALRRRKIATMEELSDAIGVDVRMTIYRSLKELGYQTSYSHGGRYYALKATVNFNERGLWSAHRVWFSEHGTLMATLEKFISDSQRGYFASELESLLHVGVKESLLRLVQKGQISRERVSHSYLYCSPSNKVRKRQIAARAAELGVAIDSLVAAEAVSNEVKAAIVLFAALLDERQLRLFAGVEALQFGKGAERWIANLLGIHRQTVAKGRSELLAGEVDFERIRKKGAGRPRVEKKRPKSSRRSKS